MIKRKDVNKKILEKFKLMIDKIFKNIMNLCAKNVNIWMK